MTSRRRNLAVLGVVLTLIVLSALIVVPGSPLSKETRLGLDLKGGVELVYEGRPTPKVPTVTPQAIDDAIETIRKRTDALGVSEPEIQRAGSDQISIGLPGLQNIERAIAQVGTTAQLQFYDWEPNIFGDADAPLPSLFEAVEDGSGRGPRAEATDIPPDGVDEGELREADVDPSDRRAVRRYYDLQNDSARNKLYLFGPGEDVDRELLAGPDATCEELLSDLEGDAPVSGRGEPREYAEGTQCREQLEGLGRFGPPAGSEVGKVPRGVVVVQAEKPLNFPADQEFTQYFVLEDDSELSGSDIENPEQNFDPQTQEPIVTMDFTDAGRRAFARVTKRIAQRGAETILPPGVSREQAFQRFAITLDNKIVSLATIDFVENPEGIDGRTGAQINGIGSLQETQDLAENLRIGALPIELRLISQTQVSATLGQQALNQGLRAGGAGLVLVAIFLLVFYRALGFIAVIGLLTYGLFLFALVKLIPITLTLPGVAGVVLTLGVAADANIVIFERIKEEARHGRSVAGAITAGYAKALRTIIDANVVTVGVAFILFTLATAGIKGFAFTLGVGTLVSLFTAVLATSAVLGSLNRSRLLSSKAALGAREKHRTWRFDFTGLSRRFFSMSGLILATGALAIAGLGINFGIDFESGTRIKTPLEQQASVQDVRDALAPLGHDDAKIQEVEDEELGDNAFQIATETQSPDETREIRERLNQEFGVRGADFTSESIGPTFGEQIARTAIIAVIASLLLISLYIGVRFEAKFAVPVLIALAHDILITAGVYAIAGFEVTSSTVAALLTILGFSLYDTIIVFDRIRENVPRMPRATFSQCVVNRSMSEVLTRSLATSFSTLMPVAALLFAGGETLRDFAFALLVGVASGTYSSVFIAAPVLTLWKEREPQWRRRRRIVMDDHGGVVPPYAEVTLGEEGDELAAGDGGPTAPPRRPRRAASEATATAVVEAPPVVEPEPQPEPEPPAPQSVPGDGDRSAAAERRAERRKRQQAKKRHGRR